MELLTRNNFEDWIVFQPHDRHRGTSGTMGPRPLLQGRPGQDGSTIRIRGVGTLNSASPYILIDGIESGSMNDICLLYTSRCV